MTQDFPSKIYGNVGSVPNGPLLVDLWREIVRLAEKHAEAAPQKAAIYDALTSEFLKDLAQVDAEGWRRLCWGLGPNVYGSVCLSWCEGARPADVWMDWQQSGYALEPTSVVERPALFLNSQIVPMTHSLAEIMHLAGSNQTIFAILVSRAGPDLVFDCRCDPSLDISKEVSGLLVDRLSRRNEMSRIEADWLTLLRHRLSAAFTYAREKETRGA